MNLESQVESYFGSLAGTPDDLDVLARLERLYGERGEWAGLVSALERRAVAGGAYAARLWMEAARLSAVRLQDMDRSALALEQAIDLAPAGALGHELDILTLALQQSWDELEGVFAQSVEALGSPVEQSQLYAALGQILAEIVGDAAQADEMFQFAQELDPTRLRVRWARQQLARGAEQWERLSELLYAELEQTQDAAEQVQLMLELGEVYLDKLEQAEAAGQCFARVYEADPSNARARAGLTRLGYELEEVAEAPAVEAVAPMAEESTPMTEEIALEEVAEQAPVAPPAAPVVEEAEVPAAVEVVEEAVAAEETAAVEASAAEEVAEAPAVEEVEAPEAVEAPAAPVAAVQTPADRVAGLLSAGQFARAAVAAWLLGDERLGIKVWSAAAGAGQAQQVWDAASWRYESQGFWGGVLGALREAGVNGLAARVAFAKARDLGAAAELAEAAGEAQIKGMLGEVEAAQADWRKYQRVAEGNYPADMDKDARNEAIFQHMALMAEALGDQEKVFDALRRLERTSADASVKGRMQRVYRDTEKWPAYVDLLKQEADALPAEWVEEKIGSLLRAVDVYRGKMNNDLQAIATYKDILKIDERHMPTIDALIALYEANNRATEQIAMLQQKAELTEERGAKVALLAGIAQLYLDKFRNQAEAIKSYEAVLEIEPYHPAALEFLKDAYDKRREWDKLIDVHRRELSTLSDVKARAEGLKGVAQIAAEKARKNEVAVELLREALALVPTDLDALGALEAIYEKAREYEPLAGVLSQRVALLTDRVEQMKLYQKLGALYSDRLSNAEGAILAWEGALSLDSDDLKVRKSLERLYLDNQRWDALEALYAQKGAYADLVRLLEGQVAGNLPDAIKIQLLLTAGRVWREQLQDSARAEKALERILQQFDAKNEAAAALLEPIYEGNGDVQKLHHACEILLSHKVEREERRHYQRKLARLHEEFMSDAAGALEWFGRSFAEEPTRLEDADDVERAAGACDGWAKVVSLYQAALAGSQDVTFQHAVRMRLGRVLAHQQGRWDEALAQFTAILAERADHVDAMAAMERIYTHLERWDDLLAVYKRRLALVEDAASRVQILGGMARVAEEQAGEPDKAITLLNEALGLLPEDEATLSELHRLYAKQRRWPQLAAIIRREIGIVEAGAQPSLQDKGEEAGEVGGDVGGALLLTDEAIAKLVVLRYELGLVAKAHLGEHGEALEALGFVVGRVPDHDGAREALEDYLGADKLAVRGRAADILEPVYAMSSAWHPLIVTLRIKVEGAADSAAALGLWERIARIYLEQTGELEESASAFGEIVRLDQAHEEARGRLQQIADTLDSWEPYVKLYEEVLPKVSDAELRVAYLFDLADAYADHLSDAQHAQERYLSILELVPESERALQSLEALYMRTEQWRDLLDVYDRRLQLAADDAGRVEALQLQMATAWEEMLGDRQEAIGLYRKVLANRPDHIDAVRALNRLYRAEAMWQDLADGFQLELDLVGVEAGADVQQQLGEVFELHLGRADDAVDLYEEVIGRDAAHAATLASLERVMDAAEGPKARASKLLEPIYTNQGQADRLVRALEVQVATSDEAEERVALLHRIAQLWDEFLSDAPAAFSVMGRALHEDVAQEHTLAELYRLAEATGAWEELVATFEREAEAQYDQDVKRTLLRRAAQVHLESRGEVEACAAVLRRVLELVPDDLETVQDLENIYRHTQEWEALVSVLLKKSELVAEEAERLELLHQAGTIREEFLSQPEEAIEVYRAALAVNPLDVQSLDRLQDLYTQLKQWDALLAVYDTKLELAADVDGKKDLLYVIGAIHQQELEQPDEAIAVYQRLLELDSAELGALEKLDVLYEKTERWHDLLETLERQRVLTPVPEDQHNLKYRVGKLWETHLSDSLQAVQVYEEVLRDAPHHEATRVALEGMVERGEQEVEAARVLQPIYEALEAWEKLIHIYRLLLQTAPDDERRLELFAEIANIHEGCLDDRAQAFSTWAEALVVDPSRDRTLETMERLARELGAWDAFIDQLDARMEEASDPEVKVKLQLIVARVSEEELQDGGAAIDRFTRVLEVNPSDEVAIPALDRLYQGEGRWQDLADVLKLRAQLALDPAERLVFQLRLGTLYQTALEDVDAALEAYRAILLDEPDNADAIDALEQMFAAGQAQLEIMGILEPHYLSRGEYDKVVDLYTQRLGYVAEAADRFALWRQVSSVQVQYLQDANQGVIALGQALKEQPDEETVAEMLQLAEAGNAWPTVANSLMEVLEAQGRPDAAALWLTLARVLDERLAMPEEAEGPYRSALQLDAGNEQALVALDRILLEQSRWGELSHILKQRVEVAQAGDEKIELHFRLAAVQQHQLGEMDEAIYHYNQVLALDPAHLESLVALEGIYLGQQRWSDLYRTLDARVSLSMDPDEQAGLLGQMANIAENMLDQRDGAVELWRRVVELVPDDGDALDQLARLYHSGERWSDLVGVLERRIELSPDPDEQLAFYENLGVIWGERIGDEVQAMEAWRNALTIDPMSLGALEALRDLHARRGEYFELGEVLKRLLEHEALDSERKLDLWVELADIQGNMLMQPEDAIVSWQNVMALDPGSALALENLERFYTQEGRWEQAVQVLEIKADRMGSEAERIDVLRQTAQICEAQLYDRPRAGQYLAQVLELDPTDEAAYNALDAIYLEQGTDEAHGALVELYLTHAEVVGEDPIARMDTLMRASKVFEERLGQAESALVVLLSALIAETVSQESLLDELERLGRQTGMWAEVLERYNAVLGELTVPADAFELSRRAGIVMAQDLGQLDDAVYYFQRSLQIDPQSVDVLDRLKAIYEEISAWPEMAQVLEARIALTQDVGEKVELWRRLGQVRELQLMQPDGAIAAYENILAIEEADQDALNSLERLFEGFERWQEFVDILEAKARHTYDPDEIVALRLRAADVYQQHLGRTDRAVATYQDILSVDQAHLESLRALENIYLAQADWESALGIMERQLAVVTGDEQPAIFGRMAAIHEEQFQDRDKAIDAYHQILGVDPSNEEAIVQLERLYAELERWFDLVSILETHVQVADPSRQVGLLTYMAEIQRDRIGDLNAAIDVFVRSLHVQFAQPGTWRALASLYEETQGWESAVESYQNLASLLPAPADKIAVFDHMGELLEVQLRDPQRSEAAYFESLRLDPAHRPTLSAVRALYERMGNWQGVIQILKQMEDTTRDLAEKGRALAAVGHVYQDQLLDPVSAVRYYEQALEYEPSLVEAAEPLIGVYISERRWERALPLLQRVLARYHAEGNRTSEELHARHLQMAQTCEMLNLHDQARDNYYHAYEYDPTNKETMLGLGRQLNRHGDYEPALQIFQSLQLQHLEHLTPGEATEIFYNSGLIKQRMGDKLRAIDFFEQALAYDPQHKESLTALLESYEGAGRWDRVIEVNRYLLQTETDPKIQLAYLTRIGDIYTQLGGQEGPAIQSYLQALGLEPRSLALLRKLLDLYTKTRQWLEAVDILRALIEVETDDGRRAKFSYTIGVIFRDEIKDPLEAVRYFDQCLDLDVRQLKAFEAVDRILTDEKDWKALERAYRQMLHRISKVEDEQLKGANLLLWQSLGEIYRSRLGLMKSAIQAYEMVVSMKPDDENTHLILAQLYEKENDAAGMIRHHRELITHNPFRIESFRALFKAYIASKEYDKAWCMASALSFLQSATETEEKFYQQYLGATLKAAKITFNPELIAMVMHPDQSRLISAIMQQLTLAFGALYASDPRDIGVNKKKDLLDPNDRSLQFCKIYSYVAARLSTVGMAAPPVLYRRLDQAIGLRNANTAPPAFLVGGDMLQGRDERELAFVVSKQLFFMLPQHYLGGCGYPTDWLKVFFMVGMHMTNPALGLDKTLGERGPELMQEFGEADRRTPGLLVQTQKLIQQFLATGKNPNLSEWLTAVDHSSNRFGLVLCGDLAKAASCIKNDTNPIGKATAKDKIRDMVVFSISEEYFELRKQLGLAIGA